MVASRGERFAWLSTNIAIREMATALASVALGGRGAKAALQEILRRSMTTFAPPFTCFSAATTRMCLSPQAPTMGTATRHHLISVLL